MPQQLLLEGPDLEALILRAREEYGPGARVVRAEKVRSGGFLGFFTHERFELTVEISDAEIAKAASTRAPIEASPSRVASAAALAAEIADAQAARESMLAGMLGDVELGGDESGTRDFGTRDVDAGDAEPTTTLAIPDRAPDAVLSTRDGAEFDRLVLALTEQASVADLPAPAAPVHHDSPPASAHAPSTARAFVPVSFPVAERGAAVVPTLDHSRRIGAAGLVDDGAAVQADRDTTVRTRTTTYGGNGAGNGAGDESRGAAPLPARDGGDDSPAQSGRPHRQDGMVLHRWGVFTDVASAVATHCTVPALLSLGVPMRCVEDYADLDSPVPLLDVVARFGTPPVRRPEPGDLIVVAGPAEHALAVATQLAGWVGLPSTAVVLAGEIDAIRGHGRRIRDEIHARAVRAKAEKVGQLGEPLIVALGVAPGRRGAVSSAPLLAAFEADTVWAVIDATKRPSTYEPSIGLLAANGRIDALAAVNVAEAQAPCAMLDASLPVAWMDGLPAAGVVWAALLGDRIASLD